MSVRNRSRLPALVVLSPTLVGCRDVDESPASLTYLGEVQFETSCDNSVARDFNVAVAMLRSFGFDDARRMFESIGSEERGCAMASWGVAMTYYDPLCALSSRSS